MQHILVATDGSAGAERAVGVAIELALTTGAALTIVTVAGDVTGQEIKEFAQAEGSIGDVLELMSSQILTNAKKHAQRLGLPVVQVQTGWGDAAETIIDIARYQHVDAIVIGRRGRGRLAGLFLGSVSQKIATLAPCTVIIVP